jgi:DNA-directed RNA polymerase subunit beta'
MKALVEGGEVIEPLRERILGRTTAADVVNPANQETFIFAGELLDEDKCDLIDALGVDEVKVRTAADLRNPLWPVRQVLRP